MSETWPIRTVVLDVDDTLYPERDFVLSGFAAAGNWLRCERGIDGFTACATSLFERGRRGKIFDEALSKLGLGVDRALVAELVRIYRDHRPRLAMFPDAQRALKWLVGRVNVAVLTDGYASVQRNKIAALDLDYRIELRIITDELGGREYWKPHTISFRRVMERYPGDPAGFLYVGDNPRKDFIAPRALGWRTVRILRPGGEHSDYVASDCEAADVTIPDLIDLLTLIADPYASA